MPLVQFVADVHSEEVWKSLLERRGLVVADIYDEWAGPCVAMSSMLRMIKTNVDLAFEWMHLATVPVHLIPSLHRFAGTSRPTFLLISNGRLIDALFGCNAPKIVRRIMEEIEREVRIANKTETRETVSLSSLCPEEIDQRARWMAEQTACLAAEKEKHSLLKLAALRNAVLQIDEQLPNHTVVVVLPHAVEAQHSDDVLGALRSDWTTMGFSIIREEHMLIDEDALEFMFLEKKLPQHSDFVESFSEGAALVLLLERKEFEERGDDLPILENVEKTIARSIYGFVSGVDDSLMEAQSTLMQTAGHPPDEGSVRTASPLTEPQSDERLPALDTAASRLMSRSLPGIWTPSTPLSRAAAFIALFPTMTDSLFTWPPPAPPPPAPADVIVFSADKRTEALAVASTFKHEVRNIGFFTKDRQPLTNDLNQFEILVSEGLSPNKTILAMEVVRQNSAPIVALCGVGPIYISPNAAAAQADIKELFEPKKQRCSVPQIVISVDVLEEYDQQLSESSWQDMSMSGTAETEIIGPAGEGWSLHTRTSMHSQ